MCDVKLRLLTKTSFLGVLMGLRDARCIMGPEAEYGGPEEGSCQLELYGASQRDWSISRGHEKPQGS